MTLCEENSNFICNVEIGTGTAFPKSSLWGTSITGNVCIIGDFEVDAPFSFQNATVKITPGVTISIKPSPNGYDSGSSMNIDNSKLFACNGLWKGITLGHLSSITTQNNSEIEDAETAISASGLCALFIQQTIFNRDRVGIYLNTPFPNIFIPGPMLWTFSGNRFTCDAPLNGTVDEITTAGIKMNDSFLGTHTGINTFIDIQYGIYSEGNASYINCRNLVFQRIRRDGIYMDKGNINLRSSSFLNCEKNGINISSAKNVSISSSCTFRWDENLPDANDFNFHSGILIGSFSVGSKVNISNSNFISNLSSRNKNINGVYLIGGNVGGGTAISISACTFHMIATSSNGISVAGNYPSTSRIDVYNNDFDVKMASWTYVNYCIKSFGGNKYNFHIIGNRFYNVFPNPGRPYGISLSGSEGVENEVSDNHFEQGLYLESFLCGIDVANFKNTKFCSNTFTNANRSFCFYGQNDGTDFTDNIAYGPQLLTIGDQSWIEDQDQEGNQWTVEYQGGIFPYHATPVAECQNPGYADYSNFFVHTAQSTSDAGSGFNPFHPKDIFPDVNDEFWSQQTGTPASGCIGEIVSPGNGDSRLKRAVSNGSLAAQFTTNPSMIWQAQRALFFALKRTPSLESKYSAYSTFLTGKTGSNIDKFYQVFTGINAAINGNAALVTNAQNNSVAIDNMILLIEADDLAWQNADTQIKKINAENTKKQHISDLMYLLSNAAGYQTAYKQDLQTLLINVEQKNNSVTPIGDWEVYEKKVNEISIDYLRNEGITESQKQQLETIAAICPKYGGMAVYRARGILPECAQSFDRDNNSDCYPAPLPVGQTEPRSAENVILKNVSSATIQPNPANGAAILSVEGDREGDFQIMNALGQVVSVQKIISSQTDLNLSSIPVGTYFINIRYYDGQRESIKLIVTR